VEAGGEPAQGDRVLRDRILEFLVKAAREAKERTSWINPNAEYEQALEQFLDGILLGRRSVRFRSAFLPFVRALAPLGMLRSLGQVALKCALPGVPDVYQGTERWDLSLVDPDNRRPVDFALRRQSLDRMEPWLDPDAAPGGRRDFALELLGRWADGEVKQYVLARALRFRRAHAGLFLGGAYRPLATDRGASSTWAAFAREHGGETLIACVRVKGPAQGGPSPRWAEPPGQGRETLLLPPEWSGSAWTNLFTDTVFRASASGEGQPGAGPEQAGPAGPGLDLSALMEDYPVAWLRRVEA
jgi:(1->4)-alpha-D-glucan 1-alpha-D-glucosylmutase